MTTQYAEEQGFKKKYLAPLIVLMLCAVSLTGAAYAYSTSVTGNGTIGGDYYTIDLYNTDGDVITASITSDDFFETQTMKKFTGNYIASTVSKKTTTVEGTEYIQIVFNEQVKVQSNKTDGTTPVSGSVTYKQNEATGGLYADWGAADAVKCELKITDGDDKEVSEIEFNKLYTVTITILLPMIKEKDTGINGTSSTDTIAKYLNFDGKDCLTITLTATDAASAGE